MAKKKKSSKKSSKNTYTPAYVTPTLVSAVAPTAPAEYQLGTYTSKYADQIQGALDKVVNWNYNPMEDANYQALAKIYGARGNIAAKNSLADAAALNGGYGTSYAVSAAQQARNQYNQELASLIPDLEANAYSKAQTTLGALRDADDTDYGRFRDTEGDRQWQYGQNYQRYQDALNQYQWAMDFNTGQQQWALDYNNALYAQQQAAKKSSGGGGGGRKSSGGGGGGGYVGNSGGGYTDLYNIADPISRVVKAHSNVGAAITKKKTGGATR